MKRWLIILLVRPFIRAEVPGWGKIYDQLVGGYKANDFWSHSSPRFIIDKRCGYFRIANIREWADRSLFFLNRWYDLQTALAVKAFVSAGDCVADVGANYGHFTMEAAFSVGPNGKVISFEPNPRAFSRLSLHVELNNLSQVDVRQIGLSDSTGQLSLSVPTINSGEATFGKTKYDDAKVVMCPVKRLDDIEKCEKLRLIKIDVEGFELNVLRGASRILELEKPLIITEVIESHLDASGESRRSLTRFLEVKGYQAFRLGLKGWGWKQELSLEKGSPVDRDGDYIWAHESDLTLINNYLA